VQGWESIVKQTSTYLVFSVSSNEDQPKWCPHYPSVEKDKYPVSTNNILIKKKVTYIEDHQQSCSAEAIHQCLGKESELIQRSPMQ